MSVERRFALIGAARRSADETISGDWTFTGEFNIGDPGNESGTIQLDDTSYSAVAKINEFGGSQDATLILHRHDASAGVAPNLVFAKTASETSSHSNVSDNDVLGRLVFAGWHTDSYWTGARIEARVNGTPGDGDMPTELRFLLTPDGSNNPAEALRIEQDGGAIFSGDVTVDGNSLLIKDSTGNDSLTASHNGTDVNFDHAGTTDWNINDLEFIRLFDGVTVQARDGGRFNALSTDDGSSCSIRHNDTDGVVEAAGGGLQLAGGHDANIYVVQTSLSDDETGTFTLPDSRKGAFCFMTAQTTTGTSNAGWHAFVWIARAVQTPVQISVGANFDIGDGSNNDTDGVVNVWMGSNGVISVKNRAGATRRICLYALTN